MIPFGHYNVTLYHRERLTDDMGRSREVWGKYHLYGCSWKQSQISSQSGESVVNGTECICRIPAGQKRPSAGDLLVLGVCGMHVGSAMDAAKLLSEIPNSFRVARVGDNVVDGSALSHYVARG